MMNLGSREMKVLRRWQRTLDAGGTKGHAILNESIDTICVNNRLSRLVATTFEGLNKITEDI